MTTFTNENIDPALLAMDPAAQLLAQLRSGSGPSASAINSPNAPHDDDEDNEMPPARITFPGSNNSLAAFGRLVKNQLKLSENSSVSLNQACQLSADERIIMLFAHVLELGDLVRKNEKSEKWAVSNQLKVLLTAYRGLGASAHVMNAMRESNVPELPSEDQTVECEEVLSKISSKATQFRNVFKTNITCSLVSGSELRNIAALTNKILSGTSIKATLEFYVRVAFLRWVMKAYPGLEDGFWLQVDICIHSNSKRCDSQKELDSFYNAIYQDDIKEYGDPAATSFKTVDLNTANSSWQAAVRRHSKLVEFNPKSEQLLAAMKAQAVGGPKGVKRARVEEAMNENQPLVSVEDQ
ncbi:hypothetical protein R3P38DRAFT_2549979 [Favolaschia claudopus]|uniref:Nucleocapsid protein n=1 Tax=Favolaschia claudopus TaxID=2862362 RepID=A0AAW0AIY6_9AGAR